MLPSFRQETTVQTNAVSRHPKFSARLWLRLHGVDLITMALMGALGLGIYEACS